MLAFEATSGLWSSEWPRVRRAAGRRTGLRKDARVPTLRGQPSRAGRVKGEDPGESLESLDAPEHDCTSAYRRSARAKERP